MSLTVYIPSLPSFFDDFSLQKIFRDFGQIKECQVMQHTTLLKSSGFVTFFNSKSAKLAASKKDQTIVERSAIRVFVVWDPKETLTTIRVSNLPNDVHVEDLQHTFLPFGDIVNVTVHKREMNTEAHVSFSRIEYAIRASEEMNDAIFGPSDGNLCVELVNAEARSFKWKRNGFEYIRNPWSDQPISSKKSSSTYNSPKNKQQSLSNDNEMWHGYSNQQKGVSNSSSQLYNQAAIQNNQWLSSISLTDINTDSNTNSAQVSPSSSAVSSPSPSVSFSSSSSLYSSNSAYSDQFNSKNILLDDTTMKTPLFATGSNTPQDPLTSTANNNPDMGNVCGSATENGGLPNNEMFQSIPSVLLPSDPKFPGCGIINLPFFFAPMNPQCMLPIPLLPGNFTSLPSLMNGATSFGSINDISSLPTNFLNLKQSPICGKQSAVQQSSSSSKIPSGKSCDKTAVGSSVGVDAKASTWTKEQQEFGNFLHSQLAAKYPTRVGKLIGMILTENKIKDTKFVNENPKAFFEKVECFNKLLDDVRHK